MGEQCMGSRSSERDCYHVQSSMNTGNKENTVNMTFENGLRSLKAQLDYNVKSSI